MAVLGLVSSMLLTRILDPTEFGLYGILISFASTAIMLISFGFDSAYTRFYYMHGLRQKEFMKMCIKYPLILFGVFAIIMLEPTLSVAKFFFDENIGYLTVIFIVIFVLWDFLHKFSQLTARMEEYAVNYTLSNILAKGGFLAFAFVLFLSFKKVEFDGIVLCCALASFCAVLCNLLVFAKVANKKSDSDASVSIKEMFTYGMPYMINNVLVLIIPLAEKIIIKKLIGETELGIFTAAAIFQTVILLLTNTLINIWNPLVYKHCENKKVFKPILHNFGLCATIVSSVGLAFCILLRRWLVLLLGANYFSVYIIAPSVLFGALYHILTIIYSVGINIEKKTYHFIISPIIQAVVSFILCFLLIPKFGLCGIALASLASLIISKTYRIAVGLYYYDSGKSEIKTIILCSLCIIASVFSMFSLNIASDCAVFAILIASTLIVTGKELLPLIKSMIGLIKPQK